MGKIFWVICEGIRFNFGPLFSRVFVMDHFSNRVIYLRGFLYVRVAKNEVQNYYVNVCFVARMNPIILFIAFLQNRVRNAHIRVLTSGSIRSDPLMNR